MSSNGSGKVKAMLGLSLMLFVIAFVIFKSGAIEKHTTITKAKGKTKAKTSTSYRFNASRIPKYLKGVVAPMTGNMALEAGKD